MNIHIFTKYFNDVTVNKCMYIYKDLSPYVNVCVGGGRGEWVQKFMNITVYWKYNLISSVVSVLQYFFLFCFDYNRQYRKGVAWKSKYEKIKVAIKTFLWLALLTWGGSTECRTDLKIKENRKSIEIFPEGGKQQAAVNVK